MSTRALGRREQNKLEKRGRIVAAARALFTHKGFEATTTQEIAAAAGVGVGTIFVYSPSKETLLIEVFHDEICERVDRAYLAAAAAGRLLEQLMTFFGLIAAYFERDPPLARALMRALGYVGSPEQRDLVSDLMSVMDGGLQRLVTQARTSGELAHDVDVEALARVLFATYHYHQIAEISGYYEPSGFQQALRTDFQFLLSRCALGAP